MGLSREFKEEMWSKTCRRFGGRKQGHFEGWPSGIKGRYKKVSNRFINLGRTMEGNGVFSSVLRGRF